MKVLELYSGIGGMHSALKESGITGEVVMAVEINTVANSVYKENFPTVNVTTGNIERLKPELINKLGIDTILMSPPCQPFTRNGFQKDVLDARTKSLLHLINIIPQTNVNNILLENVVGFENSIARGEFVDMLEKNGFKYKELLLNPFDFGIPNSRPRYYCVARRNCGTWAVDDMQQIRRFKISSVIEHLGDYEEFLVPDQILEKHSHIFDICHVDSEKTNCFTKSYGRYAEGTGSVFTEESREQVQLVYENLKTLSPGTNEYLESIRSLKLRFFTPREVARLMTFPDSFRFPNDVTNRQKYKLLGNSICVSLVSHLIKSFCDND